MWVEAETASEGLGLGFGCVRYTRSMSGKRVAISSNMEVDSTVASPPLKRQCSMEMVAPSCEKSLLEALPQDILIRVLCGVGHDDLKQLFHVSKQIREATVIAKQWHFAYSTPKKISAFRNPIDLGEFEEAKTPMLLNSVVIEGFLYIGIVVVAAVAVGLVELRVEI
ncbi:hypothetical protein C3L33_06333, partial [Rhododendron williamsianum]